MPESLDVLLVEDDVALAEMYRIKLQREGHRVRITSDGPSSLRAALEAVPDLLLLDIRLPGFDGLEVLSRLRKHELARGLPVVVLSNYSLEDMVDQSRRLGVLDYLVKSETTPADLCRWIERWQAAVPADAERRPPRG